MHLSHSPGPHANSHRCKAGRIATESVMMIRCMQRFSILLVFLASGAVAGLAQSPDKCGDLAKFQMPGAKIEITRAELVAAGPAAGGRAGQAGPVLPAHCRVNGIIDRRTGPDGKTYGIRFAIALPANW